MGRVYSRGDYQTAKAYKLKCAYCGKPTTRKTGMLGIAVCSKCG